MLEIMEFIEVMEFGMQVSVCNLEYSHPLGATPT